MKFNGEVVALPFAYEFDASNVKSYWIVMDGKDNSIITVMMFNGDTFELDNRVWGDGYAWGQMYGCLCNWNHIQGLTYKTITLGSDEH